MQEVVNNRSPSNLFEKVVKTPPLEAKPAKRTK